MASFLLLNSFLVMRALTKKRMKSKLSQKKITVCRICNEENECVAIFHNDLHLDIANEVHSFSGVQIKKSDKFSKYLCYKCLNLLKGCVKFRDMCRRNNRLLLTVKVEIEPVINTENAGATQLEFKKDEVIPSPDAGKSEESFSVPSPNWAFEANNTCKDCLEVFYDSVLFNNHLSFCNKMRKGNTKKSPTVYLCDICGNQIKGLNNLRYHRTIHVNVFPHKCPECPYRGRTFDLLRTHSRVHMAVKPYRCTVCDRTMSTRSNLQKHVNSVHPNGESRVMHKCTLCSKDYSSKSELAVHIKRMHHEKTPCECPICNKIYASKKVLRGHVKKVHKIERTRWGRMPAYLLHEISKQNGE